MGVGEVGPARDFQRAPGILGLEGAWRIASQWMPRRVRRLPVGEHTADVSEFAVFEQQELLSPGDFIQAFDRAFRKIIDDVCVRFQHADVVAHLLGQP